MQDTTIEQEIYTVSELNRETRLLLDETFPLLWVTGEISNLVTPRSGHIYFSLKDETAQVRCAMFRGQNRLLDFTPEDGMQVIVHAKVGLYEPRGDFQLIVYEMEPSGDGILQREFEKLKKKLAAEGLFDEDLKQSLPVYPQCLGVITSPTGAAIRDVLSVLKRRCPMLPVIIYPTAVQGDNAAPQIVNAIATANQRNECDVLLVTRGGGSLEDLWPFNEEMVARAIFASTLPIVSAVGHEIDFTISDFAADVRAPTPSAAAELISPNCIEQLQTLRYFQQRLNHLMQVTLRHWQQHFQHLRERLRHPGQRLLQQKQQLQYIEQSLVRNIRYCLQNHQQKLDYIEQALHRAINSLLQIKQQQLGLLAHTLHNISPLQTLERGYAIIEKDQQILRSVQEVSVGDNIKAKLKDGKLVCNIIDIEKEHKDEGF